MLRIVPYPHPALRYESRPVTRIDDDLRATARAMFDLMYASRGIGLAANQVGLPYRFFVLNLSADPEQRDQERVFINPEIVKRHSSSEEEEGCLSFPGLYAKVREFEVNYRKAQAAGEWPDDAESLRRLGSLASPNLLLAQPESAAAPPEPVAAQPVEGPTL